MLLLLLLEDFDYGCLFMSYFAYRPHIDYLHVLRVSRGYWVYQSNNKSHVLFATGP
jgi:hypothetical protein